MNFDINFCANSDKKIISNTNVGTNIPKSFSGQQLNISINLNDIDHLEDDDYAKETHLKNEVRNLPEILSFTHWTITS